MFIYEMPATLYFGRDGIAHAGAIWSFPVRHDIGSRHGLAADLL